MRLIALTVGLALTSACVPAGKYKELEASLAQTSSEKSSLESQLAERDATIRAMQSEIDALEANKRKLQGELEQSNAALAEATTKNAMMLQDQQGLEGEVERMKQALEELERRKAATEARMKEYKDLVARFQSMIDAGTLEVKIVGGRMVVAMATDILFASGSASLKGDGKDAVAEVAKILATIPEREFQIEGHTDNVPVGVDPHLTKNWDLGAERAIGVVKHMIASGMPAERISAATYAEFRPVDTNRTKEGKAKNRRIEIVVVPDLSQLPGFDELSK